MASAKDLAPAARGASAAVVRFSEVTRVVDHVAAVKDLDRYETSERLSEYVVAFALVVSGRRPRGRILRRWRRAYARACLVGYSPQITVEQGEALFGALNEAPTNA